MPEEHKDQRLEQFKIYLRERLTENTVNSYLSGLNHLSNDYGNDILTITNHAKIREIREIYGLGGERRQVGDYGRGTARNAINHYANFLESRDVTEPATANHQIIDEPAIESNRRFTYERDLHSTLENQIAELFPDHEFIGSEYSISNVRLDILLEKGKDLLVIELKAGTARYEAFGQIAMYMGFIQDEYPEHNVYGVIIASDIHESLLAACSTNESISCKKYSMQLSPKE